MNFWRATVKIFVNCFKKCIFNQEFTDIIKFYNAPSGFAHITNSSLNICFRYYVNKICLSNKKENIKQNVRVILKGNFI